MARKKTVGSLIVTMFLKSFGVVIVMMLIGVISYKFTMQYYEVSKADSQGESILDIVGDVTADAVSRNLIYCVDEETSKIKTMVIEVLNTETGNLDFITIPAHLQFAINNDVYQRLYEAGIDVPQIIKMSNLNEYFNNDTSYEYGMLLLEDYFDIDLGYYTMMNEDLFNEIFEQSEEYDYYVITEDLKKDVALLEDQSELDAFMKERMNFFKSNLKIKSKLKYSSYYMEINPELIYYYILPGVAEGGAFKVTQEEGHQLYQMVLLDQTHITAQTEIESISSEGLNIKVLNGSGGDGIAGKCKSLLEEKGFTVTKIADNPEGTIETTKIFVSKEGMGRDLLVHFTRAEIVVQELENGVDIMIIVGALDSTLGDN